MDGSHGFIGCNGLTFGAAENSKIPSKKGGTELHTTGERFGWFLGSSVRKDGSRNTGHEDSSLVQP
jgi:hypothetical protein